MENLRVTDGMRQNLLSAMKWTKFLAVVCTIGVGLIVLFALASFAFPSIVVDAFAQEVDTESIGGTALWGSFIGVLYLVIAALYVYPLIKAFALVKNTRKAMDGLQMNFEEAAC